jgi:hypothetical protein
MGSRRPSGRALLVTAAAVAALGGAGAAVWIATSAEDDPPTRTTSAAAEPSPGEPETVLGAPPEPSADSTVTTEQERGGDDKEEAASEPTESAPRETQKTHFPRERGKARAKPNPKRFAIPPAQEFSGKGNARLGSVNVRTPSVVKWTTRGSFELRFGREAFPIIAPSPSGQLIVPPYSFHFVRVIADGRWKISITPQR